MPQIPTGWFQGLRPWRVQGRAPALLSFPGSPGPETDMRSLAPVHPRPVSPGSTGAGTSPTNLHGPDGIGRARRLPLAIVQTREAEQPIPGLFQTIGHGGAPEPPFA